MSVKVELFNLNNLTVMLHGLFRNLIETWKLEVMVGVIVVYRLLASMVQILNV